MSLPILFEDAEALVIDKPAGLPLDPPRAGGESLANHLDALKLGFQRPPAPVHRLDRDTSGCLLLARTARALKRFAAAFERREVEKLYLGVVAGVPPGGEGTIALALSKVSSERDGWRMIAARKGKPAVTHWRCLGQQGGLSLIAFRPQTGRTHQIRVHAAVGLGLPLLGDPVYGRGSGGPGGAVRTMLHASRLTLPRVGRSAVAAHAPLPADFAALGFGDG